MKKCLFDRLDHYASCFLEFMFRKIQLCVKTLGADISSVTFQEFFTQVKQNLRWIYLGRFLMNLP